MRQIFAAQERGAEAYDRTPLEPSDEHARRPAWQWPAWQWPAWQWPAWRDGVRSARR